MKIRSQFFVLVAGVVVVPLLLGVAIFSFEHLRNDPAYSVPSYDQISARSAGALSQAEWDKLSGFIAHRKPDMNFIVVGGNHRVVYSTIPDLPEGRPLDDMAVLSLIREGAGKFLYIFGSPVRLSEPGAIVLMRLDQAAAQPPRFWFWALWGGGFLLGTVLVFTAGMCVFIARSITRSVTTLEDATRRIAAGELDLTIEAKGSNEILSLTASLNRMRLSLKEDSARRARFIMGVSHDLKTPLALIKGYAEAIGDGMADDPESRERSLGIIAAKVDQLEGMIDDLIDFVKVDTGEWRRRLARVPLAAFLTAYARRLEADAELLGRRAEFHLELDWAAAPHMDERLALRALENLVNNSLRYTAKGGLVVLSARREGSAAVVEVADDGPGMLPEELGRVFDPFYRGSASRREQGMGLGLTVVKGVVDSHGWSISVSSEPGKGSVFRIVMPLED